MGGTTKQLVGASNPIGTGFLLLLQVGPQPLHSAKLVDHWKPVFSQKPVDEEVLQSWMRRIKAPDLSDIKWTISFKEFQDFICHLRDSAAGPDGLVYGAYRYSPPFKKLLYLLVEAIKAVFESEVVQSMIKVDKKV